MNTSTTQNAIFISLFTAAYNAAVNCPADCSVSYQFNVLGKLQGVISMAVEIDLITVGDAYMVVDIARELNSSVRV